MQKVFFTVIIVLMHYTISLNALVLEPKIVFKSGSREYFSHPPLAYAPKGTYLATVDADLFTPNTLFSLLDFRDTENIESFLRNSNNKSHGSQPTLVFYSKDDTSKYRYFYLNWMRRVPSMNIYLWDTNTKKALFLGSHEAEVTKLGFSNDGAFLASGDSQGTIKIWDIKENRLLNIILPEDTHDDNSTTHTHKDSYQSVTKLIFSPHNIYLAVCHGGRRLGYNEDLSIKIVDTQSGAIVYNSAKNALQDFQFLGDTFCTIGYADAREIVIINLDQKKECTHLSFLESKLFHRDTYSTSYDGSALVSWLNPQMISLCTIASEAICNVLKVSDSDTIDRVLLSPDNNNFAIVINDPTQTYLLLCEKEKKENSYFATKTFQNPIQKIAFSPCGKYLLVLQGGEQLALFEVKQVDHML